MLESGLKAHKLCLRKENDKSMRYKSLWTYETNNK